MVVKRGGSADSCALTAKQRCGSTGAVCRACRPNGRYRRLHHFCECRVVGRPCAVHVLSCLQSGCFALTTSCGRRSIHRHIHRHSPLTRGQRGSAVTPHSHARMRTLLLIPHCSHVASVAGACTIGEAGLARPAAHTGRAIRAAFFARWRDPAAFRTHDLAGMDAAALCGRIACTWLAL